MKNKLLTEDNYLITKNPPICNYSPFLAFSIYQGKHLLSWFQQSLSEFFIFQNKKYRLIFFASDVIDHDILLIKSVISLASRENEKQIISDGLDKCIRTDQFMNNDCVAKGIIIVLQEDKE